MANELMKNNGGVLMTTNVKDFGIDMGEEDIVIPRLTLVQPTSKVGKEGMFYYPNTGESFEKINVVFLSNQRGRVMFNPDISREETLCASDDRLTPSLRIENPMAPKCLDCEYSKRGFSKLIRVGNDNKRQECSETQNLKGIIVDSLLPFWFIGRRTSLFPVNQFLTGAVFDCQKFNRPLYCFPVELSTKLISPPGQKYYVPVITRLGMLEKEEFERMAHKYQRADISETLNAEVKSDGSEETPF